MSYAEVAPPPVHGGTSAYERADDISEFAEGTPDGFISFRSYGLVRGFLGESFEEGDEFPDSEFRGSQGVGSASSHRFFQDWLPCDRNTSRGAVSRESDIFHDNELESESEFQHSGVIPCHCPGDLYGELCERFVHSLEEGSLCHGIREKGKEVEV